MRQSKTDVNQTIDCGLSFLQRSKYEIIETNFKTSYLATIKNVFIQKGREKQDGLILSSKILDQDYFF